jgi:BirA family transcriptional regulator, biotin operon repressor / biotin---[acetyl-CoA-carboxylase] ligase
MITKGSVLRVLSDGGFHSGEELGALLGVSRAAVWKQLQSLEGYGLQVESMRGRGYRLVDGVELLDLQRIQASLMTTPGALRLDVLMSIASTNEYLVAQQDATGFHVCIAEHQTQGRGRRGRQWVSPFGASLYLSVKRRFESGVAALEGLSLAVGVVLARLLHGFGYTDVLLKWPNDLLARDAKLGGILIEINGDASGAVDVVVGVGINVKMPASYAKSIDQPWIDLAALGNSAAVGRNALAAAAIDALIGLLSSYERRGFADYRDEWNRFDAIAGRSVSVRLGQSTEQGIALGVDQQGALLVETQSGVRSFSGGEISLRAV